MAVCDPATPTRLRRTGSRLPLALLVVATALATLPATASAAFHLIKVREVYPGQSNDSYVVLQLYATNERFVEGSSVTLYNSSGTVVNTSTFPSSVPNGANQQTILVGDSGAQAAFGVAPDLTDAGLNIPAGGGAVCWASIYDCMSWGNFSGSTSSPTGSPASPGGVTAGKALHRTIEPGCPTLLESGDDSNDSATDFSEQNPDPRNNASAIVEQGCASLPNTTIGTKPSGPTNSTNATFTFTATPSEGASFECKLDTAAYVTCTPPQDYSSLDGDDAASGTVHTFQVRAKNAGGTDPTPATHNWTVDTVAPTVTVLTGPNNPSLGNSASFTYSPNETVSNFECSLVPSGETDSFSSCPSSGKSYPDAQHAAPFADGEWTFKVRATDLAGNESTPGVEPLGTYTWTVDNSLVDETPPVTTILSKPSDPSESPTAFFTYQSNEAGSTFECALDGAAFASCPASGIAYTGLVNGPHSFQVRARDMSGNADPMPAGYSWQVAIPSSPLTPPPVMPPLAIIAPPQTTITRGPRAVTRDRTPTFGFASSIPGSTFACKIDRGPFSRCASPFTTRRLAFGRHLVQVRAAAAAGSVDPTPARSSFKVVKAKRKAAKKRKGRRAR
jgi:hypothetical protein